MSTIYCCHENLLPTLINFFKHRLNYIEPSLGPDPLESSTILKITGKIKVTFAVTFYCY